MDSRLRCRSFRTYTGQRKPRCNKGNPCVACSLLHFVVWLDKECDGDLLDQHPTEARDIVEDYIRSNPR